MKTTNKTNKLTLEKVVEGYILAAAARHLSPNTIEDYQLVYKKFMQSADGTRVFTSLKREDIEIYLASYKNVTNSSLNKYYIALSSLWTWAVKVGLTTEHIVHLVDAPKIEERVVLPFTEAEFKLLLSACTRSKAYDRPGKRTSNHGLVHAERSRAILLLLLDTGLRATELCSLKKFQLDMRNHRVQVLGKGAIERSIPFSPRTGQALWKYLAPRDDFRENDYVFNTTMDGARNNPLDRWELNKFLKRTGKRAGVVDVHTHRFRHTFAIQYLRNGGDVYTLQKLLGHSTLDMVKRYLLIGASGSGSGTQAGISRGQLGVIDKKPNLNKITLEHNVPGLFY